MTLPLTHLGLSAEHTVSKEFYFSNRKFENCTTLQALSYALRNFVFRKSYYFTGSSIENRTHMQGKREGLMFTQTTYNVKKSAFEKSLCT